MLKKWFISAFPEIEKIFSNPGPKAMPKIIKNWTFNEEVHRIRKISQSRFSLFWKVLRCWKRDSSAHFLKLRKYLKRWAQIRPKIMKNSSLNAKVHRIHKTSQKHFFRFFARYYDAEKLIHKRISWNWENISKDGPKLDQKLWKIQALMQRCIGSTKPHRSIFRFFARYYDAEKVIHKRISWNWENISI